MKKSLLSLMLVCFAFFGVAKAQQTVTIGDLDGAEGNSSFPMISLYNYSYTQQIYTTDEIGMAGTINSITVWLYGNANLYEMPFDIYMVETDRETFEGGADWEAVTSSDIVYSGSVTVHNTEAEAYTFELSTPFEYSGTGNLLIAFNNTTGSWKSGLKGKVFGSAEDPIRASFARRDGEAYDPTDPTFAADGISYQRNVIELIITPASGNYCAMPDELTANGEPTDTEFSFNIEGGSGLYNIEYKKTSSADWSFWDYEWEGTTVNLTDLEGNTSYQVKVQSVCTDITDPNTGDAATSGWKSLYFTTQNPCAAPTDLQVSDITTESVTLSWTPGYQETEWLVEYKKSVDDNWADAIVETVSGTPTISLTGLDEFTAYDVHVYNCEYALTGAFITLMGCPDDVICIGEGTGRNNTLPAHNYFKYSLTEQIYTADEIGEAGAILSIAFYKYSEVEMIKDLDIYMMSTTKNSFLDESEWIAPSASDLVYSGTVTFADYAWTTIELDSPFIYDGTSNVVVLVNNKTGAYKAITNFLAFTVSEEVNQSIYYYQDGSTELNPTAPNASNHGAIAQKNQIRLVVGEPPACPKPTNLAVTEGSVTAHSATLTWTPGGDETDGWEIEFATDPDFTDPLYIPVLTEPTYTCVNLDPQTTYYLHVKGYCEASESQYSNVLSFTTDIACPAPTDLAVTLTPGDGSVATFDWTSSASAWVLAYKSAEEDEFNEVSVTEKPFTLTDLIPETAYTAKVKAVCGGEDGESVYSNTMDFTPTDAYSLTVNNGTTTNGQVPVYGYWADKHSKSQFIIPADDLAAMQWGVINGLTFYSSNANISWGAAQFEVYMTEVDYTTFEEATLVDWTMMEKVMNEGSLAIVDNQMVVTLDAPYQYMGGNLMIGILESTSGSYSTCNWYGVSQEGATALGGYESSKSISAQSFLPKTTFAYTPGEEPNFPKNILGYTEGQKDHYYLVATPIVAGSDPVEVGMIENEYDLYAFNGENEGEEWVNYKPSGNFTLEFGQGYLYANSEDITLTFTGTTYEDDVYETVTPYTGMDTPFADYGLLGNPFTVQAHVDRPFYVAAEDDEAGVTVFVPSTDGILEPMEAGIFIGEGPAEEVIFTKVSDGKRANLVLNLTEGRGLIDRAVISFSNERQLPKFQLFENIAKLYIPQGNKDYAVVYSEGFNEMPISFEAEKNGSYTMSFSNENVEFSYLHLIDNMTGADVDLLANPSYSFNATTSDYASRFRLVFATGNANNGSDFAYISDGNIIVNGEGVLQVIDMTGRIVSTEQINGMSSVKLNAAAGVYVLQLTNGESIKTQKIVVK